MVRVIINIERNGVMCLVRRRTRWDTKLNVTNSFIEFVDFLEFERHTVDRVVRWQDELFRKCRTLDGSCIGLKARQIQHDENGGEGESGGVQN